ncbi:hypothetical protein B0T26DRAFT_792370, partial [Lasiosphaeria miniovina]
HVTASNPEPGLRPPPHESNPLNVVTGADTSFAALSSVLNRVQRHNCTEAYCLRRRRLPGGIFSRNKLCRFYFERTLYELAILTREMNPNYDMFDGTRPND